MSDVTDLVEWLRAQLDDDEGAINLWADADVFYDTSGDTGDYAQRFDADRMLAEVDAKRRIIDECAYWHDKVEAGEHYPALADRFEVALSVLRLLALPYAEREGYRPEWRP